MNTMSFTACIGIIGLMCSLSGCYYDNGEELYQHVTPTVCDTSEVSYTSFVVPLIDRLCINCHQGNTPSGAVNLDAHPSVLIMVNNGRFMGAINHAEGFSPMPKGAEKIPACQIEQLNAWIEQGAKNN